jgi:hypothetical protein
MGGILLARDKRKYADVQAVNSQKSELLPEEFPEGPYGSPMNFSLSHDWKPGQHAISAFSYENRGFHEGIERQVQPSHPTHDQPGE